MVRRTSLRLDFDLVDAARDALGTRGTTETVVRALEEVVRRQRLEALARRGFEISDEELAALRRPRTA